MQIHLTVLKMVSLGETFWMEEVLQRRGEAKKGAQNFVRQA